MSNLDPHPDETPCHSGPDCGAVAEFYDARVVPLGGVRGVTVARTLPQRTLPTVGAWCFLDLFGPADEPSSIMPHPHIGLQTVTWPFRGEIRHRDSVGSDVVIRPGQLNLMTSGNGIAHSEVAAPGAIGGHGLQLWVALPSASASIAPHFEQHRDLPLHEVPGLRATVLLGTLGSATSPATAYTPIVGADMVLDASASLELPVREDFEHAVLVISGSLSVAGTVVDPGPLLYLGTGRGSLALSAGPAGAHALLLGGEPFREDLVMWWNFVGRSHEEIDAARAAWESHDVERFADIAGHTIDERIPAPVLPNVRLRPRAHRPTDLKEPS
jgi:quercetin 2,3-dioxygenase